MDSLSMHCLLCHEKIPRLRAWTGKSEFCCDEHAELYKKQTMERLLVEEAASSAPAPALPVSKPEPVDPVLPADSSRGVGAEEADELWKLADRMAPKDEAAAPSASAIELPAAGPIDPAAQSEEEALAALRELAAEAASPKREPVEELPQLASKLEGLPSPDALPSDLAVEADDQALQDAPEPQFETLFEATADEAAPEPPEIPAEFAAQAEDFEPPEPEVVQAADALTPPDPPDFAGETDESQDGPARPRVAASRKAVPKKKLKLRASERLHPLTPTAVLPDGGYPLEPWTDALAMAGPDRSHVLDPSRPLALRRASLNGTGAGVFDAVLFVRSDRTALPTFSIVEPQEFAIEQEERSALAPKGILSRPDALYNGLIAAQMEFSQAGNGAVDDRSSCGVRQPVLSKEFMSQVALESEVLEPKCSAILSPHERDVFAVASADEDSGEPYMAGPPHGDGTDTGERTQFADPL